MLPVLKNTPDDKLTKMYAIGMNVEAFIKCQFSPNLPKDLIKLQTKSPQDLQ